MKTIMIVDDEINKINQLNSVFDDDDYKIITIDNRRKALEIMENDSNDDLELVLINTSMPDCKKPALFSMKPESKSNIDTSRAEDFLQKPYTRDDLIKFIRKKI